MDDLHKPLGQKPEPGKKRNWLLPIFGFLAVGLMSLAAYFFIDARDATKTLVALNDNDGELSAPTTIPSTKPTDGAAIESNGNGSLDLSKIKPLSPLLPLDGDEVPSAPKPAFTPKPTPVKRTPDWVPVPDLVERTEFGPLPRISEGGVRPLDAYSQSSGSVGANRVALIVGGLGLSQTGTQEAIAALPSSVTLGFSPFGNSLQRWMQLARKEGHEVILQLPMEPLGYPTIDPGPQTLTSKADAGENLRNLRWAMGRMTNYPLVMNYLGAGLANNSAVLQPILDEVRKRGLGYIDDGSIQASMAVNLAREMRLPNAQGSLVVDSVRQEQKIKSRLQTLEAVARQRGFAIGSATAFPETISAVAAWTKEAERRGILIVPASNLLKDYAR